METNNIEIDIEELEVLKKELELQEELLRKNKEELGGIYAKKHKIEDKIKEIKRKQKLGFEYFKIVGDSSRMYCHAIDIDDEGNPVCERCFINGTTRPDNSSVLLGFDCRITMYLDYIENAEEISKEEFDINWEFVKSTTKDADEKANHTNNN